MRELEEKLREYFMKCKKAVSFEELIKVLRLSSLEYDYLLDALFYLENEGVIVYCDGGYMHVPEDFCWCFGEVQESNSKQLYIKGMDNSIGILKNTKGVHAGDKVFVSKISGKEKHPKCWSGRVERVVRRLVIQNHNHCIVQGYLRKEGNHFYIVIDDRRIYISKECLCGAFVNDLVNVQVVNHVGKVIEVLKRENNAHVFKKVRNGNESVWVPVGPSYGYFYLDRDKFHEGDYVLASVLDGKHLSYIRHLNSDSSIRSEIDALIIDFGFDFEFPAKVLEEAFKISSRKEITDLSKRVDLRNLETFTIDPVDAKDLDDAVSLTRDEYGYHLYVHLANPSYYVKFMSPIFNEAFKRGFSVYPVDGVIPMLPDLFASGVCSLNEDGDKLAITCKIDLDEFGNYLGMDLFKSIIHNDKQMNYDAVNQFFESPDSVFEYLPFKDTLYRMKNLAACLNAKKMERGAISFEQGESEFALDEVGNPVFVKDMNRGDAEIMIENFMLLANQMITEYAYYLNLPFIYRNHESPTVQKKTNLKRDLVQSGYFIQKLGNIDKPEILQSFLMKLLMGKDKEEKRIICDTFLKSMSRAYYYDKNEGHYGLALNCYGTFTSPARKISDFINHMIIDEFLENGIMSSKLEEYREFIHNNCEYIYSKQRNADLLEQEINQLLLEKYIDKLKDQVLSARIVFINQMGIYIKEEHGLTGFIPLSKKSVLINNCVKYSGHDYHVGEAISVMIDYQEGKKIFFKISSQMKKSLKKNDKKNN